MSIRWASSWPGLAGNDSRQAVATYLLERFGIPSAILDEYYLFERKRGWFILGKSEQVKNGAHLKVSKVGLRAFRKVGQFIKPTTRFIQAFGRFATKAIFQMDKTQFETLIQKGEIPVDLSLEKGYVILTLKDDVILGLGFYIHGTIRSQLPGKEIRESMLESF
jgi:NOL1/NOP2/fmu family ribosome biogenesis protein